MKTSTLVLMGIQLLFPIAMVPILLPAGLGLLGARLGWLPAAPVTLGLSALLAAAGSGGAAASVNPDKRATIHFVMTTPA